MTRDEHDARRIEESRKLREGLALTKARQKNKSITYIDDDGCEITATPSGHIFYNMSDWY